MTQSATLPIDRDQAEVKAALADADISVLLMVLVELSGDMSLLDRYAPMLGKPGEFTHTIPPEMVDELLDRLATRLTQGGPAPDGISSDRLGRMMGAFVGEAIPSATCRCCSKTLVSSSPRSHSRRRSQRWKSASPISTC